MKKLISISALTFFGLLHLNAQDASSTKIFHSFGSYFSVFNLPTEQAFSSGETGYDYGIYYKFRYNLIDLADNISISAESNPSIGVDYVPDNGFLGVESPTYVSVNFGAGSTYDSDANFGLGFSAGYNVHFLTITGDKDLYGSLSSQVSIRYWSSKSNSLLEYFLRVEKFIDSNPNGTGNLLLAIGAGKYLGY